MTWKDFERAIKLMTLVAEQIEGGAPNWQDQGGQSYGWRLLHWLECRYDVPNTVVADVVNGYVRWMT